MKKSIVITLSIVWLFALILHILGGEWNLKHKTYEISYEIGDADKSLTDIENYTQNIAQVYLPDSYLGSIILCASSGKSFDSLVGGTLEFVYCKNIGDLYGIYKYDRFVRCSVFVNLDKNAITNVEIYGNDQMGGLQKLTKFPEFEEIKLAFDDYYKDMFDEGYEIISGYAHILANDNIISYFSVSHSNGNQERVRGYVKKCNSRCVFIEE